MVDVIFKRLFFAISSFCSFLSHFTVVNVLILKNRSMGRCREMAKKERIGNSWCNW